MANIQQRSATDDFTFNPTRVSAFEARLMRQQAPLCASVDGEPSPLIVGDVILQAEIKSGGGGDLLISLEACEALDLAKQLIASATSHLKQCSPT